MGFMRIILIATSFMLVASACKAASVILQPIADATIFQNNPNNGSGASNGLFVGTNMTGAVRRSLIAFDLTGIPINATIQSVELRLTLGQISGGSPPASVSVSAHRVLNSWAEGTTQQQNPPSDTLSGMGQGASAVAGDVTWNARVHSETPWTTAGGDFTTVGVATTVGAMIGSTYTFSSPQLLTDVQDWVGSPATNKGWAIKADESTPNTLRGFYSSEVATDSLRPSLAVTFETAGPIADFSGNGIVDAHDFEIWVSQYGVGPGADADGDQDSDGADFLIWQRELSPAITTSVPEPGGLGATVFGVAACFVVVNWRSRAGNRESVA